MTTTPRNAPSESLREHAGRLSEALGLLDETVVERFAATLHAARVEGRFVFVCGNGGSGANASHLCQDLGKGCLGPEELDDDEVARLRVVGLTDCSPYLLAWANDAGFERVFVEQLRNLASPGDLLVAFSGSGNSENVLRAVSWANDHGLETWGMTGFDGGRLAGLASGVVHVPVDDMGIVETAHLAVIHWLQHDLRRRTSGAGRPVPTTSARTACPE